MGNIAPYVWLIVAVVMGIVEACTAQLVSIWFTCGAIASAITTIFTDNIIVQIVVFVLVTALSLIATRPLVHKINNFKKVSTNSDQNIGKVGVVISDIKNQLGVGQVKIDGKIWSARSLNDEEFSTGDDVRVVRIEGVKLIVCKA